MGDDRSQNTEYSILRIGNERPEPAMTCEIRQNNVMCMSVFKWFGGSLL